MQTESSEINMVCLKTLNKNVNGLKRRPGKVGNFCNMKLCMMEQQFLFRKTYHKSKPIL